MPTICTRHAHSASPFLHIFFRAREAMGAIPVFVLQLTTSRVASSEREKEEAMIATELTPEEIAAEVELVEQMRADEAQSDAFLASLEDRRTRRSYQIDPALIVWEI